MAFPSTQDVFSREANEVAGVGGTFTDANKQNAVYALLEQMQLTYGLSGDVASSLGSHTAQIKYLLAGGAGGIVQAPAAPAGPTDGMLWIDNDQTPPGLYRWKAAESLWHLVGADALGIGGRALDAADVPANGDAITWDAANNRWNYAPPVGFTDPMTTVGDLLYRNASNVTARLPLAPAEGMMLARSGGVPAWVTAAYIPAPGTPQQGDTLFYDGATWTRLGPGTSGQFLKTQGGSANPIWSALPAAGGAITSPAGSVQGDVLYYSGTDWVRLAAGTSGQFLRTAGTGANPNWATPASGMPNPMTSQGDVIYGDIGGGPLRLPRGSNGQVLTLVAGLPGWAASASGGHAIQEEGTPLTQRAALNFIGAQVTATDDAANNRTNITVTAGAGTGGHTIQDEGTPLTARTGLNFIGASITAADDSANDRTNITVLAYNQVKDAAGSSLTPRTVLKFAGTGVAVADTAGETVATITAGFADPLTTTGDLIYRASGGTTRLGIGSANQVLTVSGGVPVWATPGAATGWALDGNTVGVERWLGTADGFSLPIRTNNIERIRINDGSATNTQVDIIGNTNQPGLRLLANNVSGSDQFTDLLFANRETGPHTTGQLLVRARSQASYGTDLNLYLNNAGGQDSPADDLRLCLQGSTGKLQLGGNLAYDAYLAVVKTLAGGAIDALLSNTDNSNAASSAHYRALVGGTSAGDPYLSLEIGSGTSWGVGVDNSDRDWFKIFRSDQAPGTNDALGINTANNVGIGTNEIGARLDVEGSFAVTTDGNTITASKSTTTVTKTAGASFVAADVGKLLVWADGTIDVITGFTSATVVTVAASATIASQSAQTRSVQLYTQSGATGRVGVGTANPLGALHVGNGTGTTNAGFPGKVAQFHGTGDTALFVKSDAGAELVFDAEAAGAYFGTTTNHGFSVMTNNSSRMIFSTLGVAQFFPVSPGAAGMLLNQGDTANSALGLTVQCGNAGSGTATLVTFQSRTGSALGSITYNGTAVAYNTSSDARLKQDIRPTARGLDWVRQFAVRDFEFLVAPGVPCTGLVAQDVEALYPEVVTEDAEGLKALDYGRLSVPALIGVLALADRCDALEARLAALEAKN